MRNENASAERRGLMFEEVSQFARPTSEDKENLVQLFHNKAFKALLKEVLLTADAKAQLVLATDMTTDVGTNEARKLQGQAIGISECVELILELVEPDRPYEPKPEEKTNG